MYGTYCAVNGKDHFYKGFIYLLYTGLGPKVQECGRRIKSYIRQTSQQYMPNGGSAVSKPSGTDLCVSIYYISADDAKGLAHEKNVYDKVMEGSLSLGGLLTILEPLSGAALAVTGFANYATNKQIEVIIEGANSIGKEGSAVKITYLSSGNASSTFFVEPWNGKFAEVPGDWDSYNYTRD